MAIALTIAATDRTAYLRQGSVRGTYAVGSRGTLECLVREKTSGAGVYRPAIDDAIVLADGATTIFSGKIIGVEDFAIVDPNTGTYSRITAVDQSQLAERTLVNATYASGSTLKSVVSAIVTNYLSALGVTLDSGMATGATLEEQVFEDVYVIDALNHLSDVTGWIWRIAPDKTLYFDAPGSTTATISPITDSNGKAVGGVRWRKGRGKYANQVTVRYGTAGAPIEKTDTFTGDSSTRDFTLTYEAVVLNSTILSGRGYVTETGVYLPLGVYGVDTALEWTYDVNTNQIRQNPIYPVLTGSDTLEVIYNVQFPQRVTVSDATEISANGTWEAVFDAPDLFDLDAATELANGLLRRHTETPKEVEVETREGFANIGEAITLTFTDRTVSGAHLITALEYLIDIDDTVRYRYTCLEGTEAQGNWTDYFRGLGRGATSASGLIAGGGATTGGGTNLSGVVGPIFRFVPPILSDFSWVNQGSATAVEFTGPYTSTDNAIFFRYPSDGTTNFHLLVKSAPAVPYTITACLLTASPGLTNFFGGILFRESSTGRLHVLAQNTGSSALQQLVSAKWTSPTVFSANYSARGWHQGNLLWLRIVDDGANRQTWWSTDGTNFIKFDLTTVGRTDFLTGGADQVGFGGYASASSAGDGGFTVLSWDEATPAASRSSSESITVSDAATVAVA